MVKTGKTGTIEKDRRKGKTTGRIDRQGQNELASENTGINTLGKMGDT